MVGEFELLPLAEANPLMVGEIRAFAALEMSSAVLGVDVVMIKVVSVLSP